MDSSFGPLILTIIAALIAAIPPTLAALAAYKQSMAALSTSQETQRIAKGISEKASEQATKTESLVGRVDQVHTLTNSNLSQVRAELAMAATRIENLIAVVSELKSERSKAEVREALHTPVPVIPERRADDPTLKQQLDVQKEIAKNTEETAENTSKPA